MASGTTLTATLDQELTTKTASEGDTIAATVAVESETHDEAVRIGGGAAAGGVGGRVLGNIEEANLELVGDVNLFYHIHLSETPRVLPYVEARAVFSEHDQAVLTVGLIFGHAHFTR